MGILKKRLEKLESKKKPSELDGVVIILYGMYQYLGKKYTKAEWENLCKERGVKKIVYITDSIMDNYYEQEKERTNQ